MAEEVVVVGVDVVDDDGDDLDIEVEVGVFVDEELLLSTDVVDEIEESDSNVEEVVCSVGTVNSKSSTAMVVLF